MVLNFQRTLSERYDSTVSTERSGEVGGIGFWGGGGGIIGIFGPSAIFCGCTRVKDSNPTRGVFNVQQIYPKLGVAAATESTGFNFSHTFRLQCQSSRHFRLSHIVLVS